MDVSHKKTEDEQNWVTPKFIRIKKKKSKRLSPYTIDQIWEKDELQSIIKHEPDIRNKAILALLWDFDARNHEVTTLDIRNIIFREKYAEGQISHKTKTGTRQILLRLSFAYVRDWLNNYHPDKSNPYAKLICSHKPTIKYVNKEKVKTYGKLDADSLWWIMKELKKSIKKKLDEGLITDEKEAKLLEHLWKTKSWNPYCIRHSAITDDNANLKGDIAAKVGWTPNTKQRNRYVKSKMGNDMKKNILERDGIFLDDAEKIIPSSKICYRCNYINGFDYQVCQSCGYPISQEALNRIKEKENEKFIEMKKEVRKEVVIMRFEPIIENLTEERKKLKQYDNISPQEQLEYFMQSPKGKMTKSEDIELLKEMVEKGEVKPIKLIAPDEHEEGIEAISPSQYEINEIVDNWVKSGQVDKQFAERMKNGELGTFMKLKAIPKES